MKKEEDSLVEETLVCEYCGAKVKNIVYFGGKQELCDNCEKLRKEEIVKFFEEL